MNHELLHEISSQKQNLKYFHVLCCIYIAGLIASITVSARLLPIHIPFTHLSVLVTGGTWIIPISFFIQDITTEVYGYSKSRELAQISVLVVSIYILYLMLTTHFPIPKISNVDYAYNKVFNTLPRHLLALMAAIFTGNVTNNYLLSKLKIKLNGKYLPARFIISTTIGEMALQFVGTIIAWFGTLSFSTEILPFVVFSYLYKIIFEVLLTPVNVFTCKWLKKAEGIDVFDLNINYNPFSTEKFKKQKMKETL